MKVLFLTAKSMIPVSLSKYDLIQIPVKFFVFHLFPSLTFLPSFSFVLNEFEYRAVYNRQVFERIVLESNQTARD